MFDRLVDLIIEFMHLFRFWFVLQPYEQGVLVRLGRFVRVMEPGFHWILPFGVDMVHSEGVVPATHSLGDEATATKDGRTVAFHAVVTYQVRDIRKAMLDVFDTDHAVRDACAGEIGKLMRERTWEDLQHSEALLDDLTAVCRKRGFRYGIEIMSVQLASLALAKNIRIMQR
jgi:regulator of protease activity HflC (stomatin/prohibitin superfamily)